MSLLPWLDPDDREASFPPVELALKDPDGLLAVGGSLDPDWLLKAYRQGIFPWYTEGQPILWWSPDPRAVLFPDRLQVSRSLRKTLRKQRYRVTADTAFDEVIEACAGPRAGLEGTWITPEMADAYRRLRARGAAHSVEAWSGDRLAGGLYGVAIGRVFFGESMFTRETDASKVAFVHLVCQLGAWGFGLIDCQLRSQHLERFGAEPIPRSRFNALLERHCTQPGPPDPWVLDAGLVAARIGDRPR